LTSIEELQEQLQLMQQQMASALKPKDNLPIKDELFLVYNPHNVRVWCSKLDCPHLGRESRIDMVKQPIDKEAAEAMGIEEDEVEVPVVRVSEPKNGAHPLGIIAAFGTEREATIFVEKYYRRNNGLLEESFQLCVSKLLI